MSKKRRKADTVKYKKEFQAEARRLVSMANKRIRRLVKSQESAYNDNPAIRQLKKDGIDVTSYTPFSVKGKNFQQVQSEYYKMKRFLDNETSTVRGTNKVLKEMAKNTGIKYKKISDLYQYSKNFFDIQEKIQEYLNSINGVTNIFDYKKLWEQTNKYIKDSGIDLGRTDLDLERISQTIGNLLEEHTLNTPKDDWEDYLKRQGIETDDTGYIII